MKINQLFFSSLLLSFFSFSAFSQNEKSIFERMASSRFIEIRIQNCVESYCREEVNILYKQDDVVKVHSICLSTYLKEKQTDTIFTLNAAQLKTLNRFDQYFTNQQFPENATAGAITTFGFIINNQVSTLRNKSGYSFIEELLR